MPIFSRAEDGLWARSPYFSGNCGNQSPTSSRFDGRNALSPRHPPQSVATAIQIAHQPTSCLIIIPDRAGRIASRPPPECNDNHQSGANAFACRRWPCRINSRRPRRPATGAAQTGRNRPPFHTRRQTATVSDSRAATVPDARQPATAAMNAGAPAPPGGSARETADARPIDPRSREHNGREECDVDLARIAWVLTVPAARSRSSCSCSRATWATRASRLRSGSRQRSTSPRAGRAEQAAQSKPRIRLGRVGPPARLAPDQRAPSAQRSSRPHGAPAVADQILLVVGELGHRAAAESPSGRKTGS